MSAYLLFTLKFDLISTGLVNFTVILKLIEKYTINDFGTTTFNKF